MSSQLSFFRHFLISDKHLPKNYFKRTNSLSKYAVITLISKFLQNLLLRKNYFDFKSSYTEFYMKNKLYNRHAQSGNKITHKG